MTENTSRKLEYNPIGSSRKVNLLLQRSFRYSYRKRCCRYCPTILCEILFPLILIIILILIRYQVNQLDREINGNRAERSYPTCSQDHVQSMTLSKGLLSNCSKSSPRPFQKKTHLIFQSMNNNTAELAETARIRLKEMGCNDVEVQ